MILEDISVHWNSQEDRDTKFLPKILRSANLIQHDHILDLVITREGGNLVRGVSVSSSMPVQVFINACHLDLKDTQLLLDPAKGTDQSVDLYDSSLRGLKRIPSPR